MAEWKKVVVSGSNISQLNNDLGFLESAGSGIVSGSSQISFTGITNVPAGLVSGSAQITMGGDLSGTANNVTVNNVKGVALESGEVTQLANIDSTTISSTQWGYVGALNQGLTTTSAVTFATVNTGQGANELYAMDQNVRTTDDVIFGSITGKVDETTKFNFDKDTGITTIATASVSQNLTVGGDLIVNGDLSYINTTNTLVEDQFILLGSGSGEGTDKGIIFDAAGGATTGTGVAFFWDGTATRLSYATSVSHTATTVTPAAYIPLVFDVTGAGHTADTNVGNIKIESGEAYIYV